MKQIFDVDGLPAESFLVVADFADRLPDCVFYFRLADIGAELVSPAMTIRLVVAKVSIAVRAELSLLRYRSTTASDMRSQTLSGCPSETDSDVNRYFMSTSCFLLWRGYKKSRRKASFFRKICRNYFSISSSWLLLYVVFDMAIIRSYIHLAALRLGIL